MRIDSFLVEKKYFSTRRRAQQAIERGCVEVNGVKCSKASKQVSDIDKIIVDTSQDYPAGYWKLSYIQKNTNIIHPKDIVLDIGSSAGGFIQFCRSLDCTVYGLEFAKEFEYALSKFDKDKKIKITFGDAFKIDFSKVLENNKANIILNDLTMDPLDSFAITKRILPFLEKKGKLVQVCKGKKLEDVIEMFQNIIQPFDLRLQTILEGYLDKKEYYLIVS